VKFFTSGFCEIFHKVAKPPPYQGFQTSFTDLKAREFRDILQPLARNTEKSKI